MTNPLALLALEPAIRLIFRVGVEITEKDFMELTRAQYRAYRRKMGPTDRRIYRIALVEPSVIERTERKVTYELEIVDEREKDIVLEAVRFIRHSSKELDPTEPTFAQRLEYLGKRWPRQLTGLRK
jgi:hypothetical protein